MTKILISYLCIGIAFFLSVSVFGARRVLDSRQPENKFTVDLSEENPVSQSITPLHNGLNVVRIFMKNVALRNRNPLTFDIVDPTTSQVIRSINLNGTNVGDGDNVRFQFAPIADSANHSYTIRLQAPTTQIQTAIGIGMTDNPSSYSGGKAKVGDRSGQLTFELFYRPQNLLNYLLSIIIFALSRLLDPLTLILATMVGFVWFKLANKV